MCLYFLRRFIDLLIFIIYCCGDDLYHIFLCFFPLMFFQVPNLGGFDRVGSVVATDFT